MFGNRPRDVRSDGACPTLAALPIGELAQRRAAIAAELEAAEARWLEVSEQLEKAAA